MKLRIARKKIKNDVLLQLWYKHMQEWYVLHIEHSCRQDTDSFQISLYFYKYSMKQFAKLAFKKYGIKHSMLNRITHWSFSELKKYNYV